MGLRDYWRKRNFKQTAEPKGAPKRKKTKKPEFVVQEHRASSHHYDFRLEVNGVLKSWAVPKGPSLNPRDRHLAMMVEDHPFEYRQFEGTIPEGNYGAGEVIIWDKGTYEPRKSGDPDTVATKQLKKGHFSFILHGEKLHGEFALIHMENAKQKNAWLLIKKEDEYASEEDITKRSESVISGKTLHEPFQTYKNYPKQKVDHPVKPMLATLVDEPFDGEDWLFEIKWDGYRAIASKDDDKLLLYSRNNLDFRTKYAAVAETLHDIRHDVVLDGEIVVVDDDGQARFEWLQNYHKTPGQGHLRYYVFDILWINGHDVRTMPLIERKELLKAILPNHSVLRYSDHIQNHGAAFFREAEKRHLEGVMAKRATSEYKEKVRGKDWLKVKTHQRQEVVIGGFTEPRGSRKHIGALLVGVYESDGDLVYVGHSGGGITDAQLKSLHAQLKKLERETSPFSTTPKPNAPVHWVEPKLVCEMEFSEWTKEGYMRQPKFMGLREDKNPRSVRRERAKSVVKTAKEAATMTKETQSGKLRFTHLDKPYFPERGYTKGDLIDYYRAVSDFMLPYLKGRPHSLKRNPEGYNGFSFFQKDITFQVPSFVGKITIHSDSTDEDVHYMVCNNKSTLLYMAQLGCIEINPWNSRVSALGRPDWLVIDLDPVEVEFTDVVKVAKTVHEVCEEWKVPNFPKTSGKRGIHIYVPLHAKYDYDQARDFAHLIAIEVNKRQPKLTSLERSPSKRKHKVYLDYLQNSEGQTLAAPYSVRPTIDATVSTPLHWDEVNARLTPQRFTIKNIPQRLEKEGDLWEGVRGKGVDIAKVLRHLE